MDIHIGAKVVPIKKTAGHRDFDSCAMHYRMLERDQPFLYVTAEAYSDHSRKKERTFWCNVDPFIGGDLYSYSDLRLYVELPAP
jgi:hypothetical protein